MKQIIKIKAGKKTAKVFRDVENERKDLDCSRKPRKDKKDKKVK